MACLLDPDGTPHPPAHNVVICQLDGQKYVLDVGYGGPVPREPLPLKEGTYHGFSLKNADGVYILERVTNEGVIPFLQFRDIPARMSDLIPLNFYISQNPASHFRHIIHVNQRKTDGSVYSLDGNTFKIHSLDQTTEETVTSIDRVKTILRQYFHLDPDKIPLRDTI